MTPQEHKMSAEAHRNECVGLYREMLQKLSPEQAALLGAEAFYHLQILVGTRNSFETVIEDNVPVVSRTKAVEDLQHEAVRFYRMNQP